MSHYRLSKCFDAIEAMHRPLLRVGCSPPRTERWRYPCHSELGHEKLWCQGIRLSFNICIRILRPEEFTYLIRLQILAQKSRVSGEWNQEILHSDERHTIPIVSTTFLLTRNQDETYTVGKPMMLVVCMMQLTITVCCWNICQMCELERVCTSSGSPRIHF